MEADLRLSRRDGALNVFFSTKLTRERCEELFRANEKAATQAELRKAVESLAKNWGQEVTIVEL